jgi:hypothetical protein
MRNEVRELLTIKNLCSIFALCGIFSIVLGVSTFILTPAGITYEAFPATNILWLIFGLALVQIFVPVTKLRFSTAGIIAVVLLIIFGLATSLAANEIIPRSVKILEILFQDLVIASTLTLVGAHLSKQNVRLSFSILFLMLHIPVFFIHPLTYALTIVLGAFLIGYVSITWFTQNDHDIATIILPHIFFYLVFGTAFSVIFW